MRTNTLIHWFRQDLRISDNPALLEAANAGRVLPVYIFDDVHPAQHAMGSVSRWWLHHSLHALNKQLDGNLQVYSGDPVSILSELAKKNGVQRVYWNRCHEPWRLRRDSRVKERLQADGIEVRSYNGSLLWEPWDVLKKDGTPYKVFTPYYTKGCLNAEPPRKPLSNPKRLAFAAPDADSCTIEDLALLPRVRWDRKLEPHWNIGEAAAHDALRQFLEHGIINYKDKRNFPAQRNVSRLSPHLHWGEISPHQVWYASACIGIDEDVEHFHRELGWREFSNYLLYHFPELPGRNFNPRFDRFAWADDPDLLACWQRGQTGIPIVDAGMRELWETGYMHNRVRMIVASFLTKNLLIHWHHGEAWFWDCLADANLASNSASWQWVAGCGADAAPYFRIFNPVTQGQKFDPSGEYTRRFVPELDRVPDPFLFSPWEAPADILRSAGVVLGDTYPHPVVDLKTSRERALEAYAQIKG
jgi:deoxyribodipyrimidine photo-lyase